MYNSRTINRSHRCRAICRPRSSKPKESRSRGAISRRSDLFSPIAVEFGLRKRFDDVYRCCVLDGIRHAANGSIDHRAASDRTLTRQPSHRDRLASSTTCSVIHRQSVIYQRALCPSSGTIAATFPRTTRIFVWTTGPLSTR